MYFLVEFWPHITGPCFSSSKVSLKQISGHQWQWGGQIRQQYDGQWMERISNNCPWFLVAIKHCLKTAVAAAFSSQYYRTILSNIQGESDMNFRPPMAMQRAHWAAIWWPVDGENFPQSPLIFVCKLTLSKNRCYHSPVLPILQGHPVQHPRWVWYEF